MAENVDIVAAALRVPFSLISMELEGLYGSQLLAEMQEIIDYYRVYERGADFKTEGSKGDYIPSDLRFKQASTLVNKEARFLFSRSPDLWVDVAGDDEAAKEANTILQNLVDRVMEKNRFQSKLLRAAKDCFIGKRVAYLVNFNEEKQTIKVDFIPSLEFVYETDEDDTDTITKIVAFYTVVDNQTKADQRIYKKKYWMENGYCHIEEAIYDGLGTLVDEITPARATKFTYIPAGVIVNDGLTGDLLGESEIASLEDFESWFSRLSNADMDAERQGMNPVRWARDMNPESTKGLSIAAGAFWDLQTDQNTAADGVTGEVGVLETSMNYTSAITSTLNRIKSSMFDSIDMPDVSPEALKGVVSSGKTLKAIYWGLIVRCDEKMLAWRPAIKNIMRIIIEGSKLYPGSAVRYVQESIPDVEFDVRVENQYPLPEDEAEEKTIDLAEVAGQTMSRKAYMKKWRNLNDEEADAELEQIARERELLEDSFSTVPPTGQFGQQNGDEGGEEGGGTGAEA